MTNVEDNKATREVQTLDEIALSGAQRMLKAALEVEVEEYLSKLRECRDDRGRALVVRNGHARERRVTIGAGTMEIRAPRVNDKRVIDGERQRFISKLLPPYLRRSKSVSELLPLLYLRGLSTGDFREALPVLLGENASGLSPAAITRLTHIWQTEYETWKKRPLGETDYIYVWVDGVHFNVRLEDDRLCTLVMIGVRPDGNKEVIAIEDGYRESADSWASLLRDVTQRGMRAPEVAVGDGALGFWAALRDVWPEAREQRCWVHKIANVLDKLPKSVQPKAKSMLHEAMNAPTVAECNKALDALVAAYEEKYPKATKAVVDGRDKLLTHFDFPAAHWKHLRTTNPIESTFATVKLRQRVTKGAGSRAAGLAMVFKLMLAAQRTWRCINGYQLLPQVRAHVVFRDGVRVDGGDATSSTELTQPKKRIRKTKVDIVEQDAA